MTLIKNCYVVSKAEEEKYKKYITHILFKRWMELQGCACASIYIVSKYAGAVIRDTVTKDLTTKINDLLNNSPVSPRVGTDFKEAVFTMLNINSYGVLYVIATYAAIDKLKTLIDKSDDVDEIEITFTRMSVAFVHSNVVEE